jgi:predicted DCC family thiol-disulfide oxidoreductase YuxK
MNNSWTGGQYSVYRAILGVFLVSHFVALLPWAAEVFSNRGVLPASASPLLTLFPNVLAVNDSPIVVTILIAIGAAAAVLLAIGLSDRIAAVVAWYVLACLFGRNPLISNPSLPFIGWLLLLHACLPPAPYGSWAARIRVDPRGGWHFPPALFAAAWIVMSLAYSYSGYMKLVSPSWVDGTALTRVLNNPLARPGFIRDLALLIPAPVLLVATWGALALELLYAPLALFARLRPWIWLAMVGMHLGLMVLIDFAELSIGMLILHLLTFDPQWVPARWPARRDRILYDGTCGLCHGAVRFVLAEDRRGDAFTFSPLQESAGAIEAQSGRALPDSMVVHADSGDVLVRSRAVLYIGQRLGGLWRVLATAGQAVPLAVRDAAYDFVARVRYRVFGRAETLCPVLPPDLRARFFATLVCTALVIAMPGAQQGGRRADAQPAGHRDMLRLLARVADQADETNFFVGEGPARQARANLAALPPTAPDAIRWTALMQVAEEELRLGNYKVAIDQLNRARDLLARTREKVDPAAPVLTRFRLGVAYMRLGETENCLLNPAVTSCILPIRGEAVHTRQNGSRQAIAMFTDVLKSGSQIPALDLATRWLLNIAYMTVGEYPDKVPAPYLIPPKAFESEEDIPRFRNIAREVGLETFNIAGSTIADDFDGDSTLDLIVSQADPRGQLRFYRGQDGSFVDRTKEAGLTGMPGGLNVIQADYDNDGDVDALVLRGGWLEKFGRYPKSLLRNNGNGTFTDVTMAAGLAAIHFPTQTGAWGDYDNDGDLDLYVGNESQESIAAPSQLFRNNGNGTFTDVAAEAGVKNDRYAKAVVWGDYNGDRWPDIYVSNYKGANRLYRNNANGTFTDVAEELGITQPISSFPAWFWDFDNDGVLDIYVAAYSAEIADLAASALGLPVTTELAKLYRGTGNGRFEEVSRRYNLTTPNAPMGSNFGDLDNDGYLDFYLGTGYPRLQNLMPNVMYRNRRGKGFADVSTAGGFAHLQKGHGVVFADFDHDGDQDIFEEMGGAFPGDRAHNVFYENPGFGHHWLTLKLVGVKSNRSAIGARIRAEIVEDGQRRSVYKHVNSGGTFGANPLRQTIGLGKASSIDVLDIFWPTTGVTQTFKNVRVDQAIEITEGASSYTPLALKPVKLGGGAGHDHAH